MGNQRMRLSSDEVNIINQSRAKSLPINANENDQVSSVYLSYLKERGISPQEVISCKHWQAASGEPRFSIVTKNDIEEFSHDDEIKLIDSLQDVIKNHEISYPKPAQRLGDHLLVINPADIHIGKLAIATETGEEYNKEIAKERVLKGIQGLIDKSKGFDIDRVLFCIGNDILHVDNTQNSTTKGTHQDMDGMWWQSFELALEVYVAAVEMLLSVAPVDCVHSMSNHDYQSGFHLAHCLSSWFKDCKDVTVDASPSYRKYYQYASNMIGLEHGDGAKMDNLPLIMAQEEPRMWAECRHRVMFLHHLHHKIKVKFQSAKDYIGVTVEYMRSPSGADSWHAKKGYKGAPKAVEGFIIHKENGRVASLVHNFK
tara:strand:- start:302 stop:1411 length:1110 start_codon:yes stop_codon:yes gene_type:complete